MKYSISLKFCIFLQFVFQTSTIFLAPSQTKRTSSKFPWQQGKNLQSLRPDKNQQLNYSPKRRSQSPEQGRSFCQSPDSRRPCSHSKDRSHSSRQASYRHSRSPEHLHRPVPGSPISEAHSYRKGSTSPSRHRSRSPVSRSRSPRRKRSASPSTLSRRSRSPVSRRSRSPRRNRQSNSPVRRSSRDDRRHRTSRSPHSSDRSRGRSPHYDDSWGSPERTNQYREGLFDGTSRESYPGTGLAPNMGMLVPGMEPGMMPNMGMLVPNMGMFPFMPGQPVGYWQPEPVHRQFRVYIGELPTDVTDVSNQTSNI